MDMCDAVMVFLDERHGRNVIASDEVPEVDICAVIFGQRKRLFPMRGRRGGVAVITDHELVLVGKVAEAFKLFILVRNFSGDGAATQRSCEREDVIKLVVAHLEY